MPGASDTLRDFQDCVIDDRYYLGQVLGTGSYGVVYQAVDLHDRTDLQAFHRAIKIVSKVDRKPSELEAVRREVALHSMVSGHPNIVPIYDAVEDEEHFYIILGLCEGGDLYDQICEKEVYANDDNRLRKAFLSLVEAVQACHRARIFHRDLKPENILTNEDATQVYLADFGLATEKTIVNEHGCGTEYYMSPECVGNINGFKPYCTRFSDIWALGVILVNMICGRHPWAIAAPSDECFAQFLKDRNFFQHMLPISDGANTILRRIFRMNPLQRITLTELHRAVRELDTFFMSPEELAGASEYARMVAAEFKPRRVSTGELSLASDDSESSEDSEGEIDGAECHRGGPPSRRRPAAMFRTSSPNAVISIRKPSLCSTSPPSSVSSSMSTSSDSGSEVCGWACDKQDMGDALREQVHHAGLADP